MARPKAANPDERRTAFVGANLTTYERSEIERRASLAGLRLADFVRLSLLSERPGATTRARLAPDIGRQLAVELARVGNNLNQLARHANSTGALPVRDALSSVLNEIVRATEALTQL